MKFITKIKLAFATQSSLDLMAKNKYQKTINTLEKYRSFVDNEIENIFPEFYILLGESYYHITNYRIAEGCLLKALKAAEKTTKLNRDEINYLNVYIYYWLYRTYRNLYDKAKASQCLNQYREITYNIKNVRKFIKDEFPIEKQNNSK